MDIKNEMEALVRAEFERVKSEQTTERGNPRACWCALCEADVIALALTLLPPCYCRGTTYGYSAGLTTGAKIHDAVQSALKRIGTRPKHPVDAPSAFRSDITLINYTLEVGSEIVGPALGRSATGCGCRQCRSDALAYALNRYPPKYGVLWGGRRKLPLAYLDFMRHELKMLISQAVHVVSTRPHH